MRSSDLRPRSPTTLHAREAVTAAVELLEDTGIGTAPVAAGRHRRQYGRRLRGAVGTGEHVEFTALGDEVNVTARLATVAGPGEVFVTDRAAAAAGLSETLEHRTLRLRGKHEDTEVAVLSIL